MTWKCPYRTSTYWSWTHVLLKARKRSLGSIKSNKSPGNSSSCLGKVHPAQIHTVIVFIHSRELQHSAGLYSTSKPGLNFAKTSFVNRPIGCNFFFQMRSIRALLLWYTAVRLTQPMLYFCFIKFSS